MHARRSARRLALASGLLAGLLPGAGADAAAIWPGGPWQPLTLGAGVYTDLVGDENPDPSDLVGGDDGSGSFTAGFWYLSEAADQLSRRMRLDADGTGTNNVWQFALDTDGVPETLDWVLQVRQSGTRAAARSSSRRRSWRVPRGTTSR